MRLLTKGLRLTIDVCVLSLKGSRNCSLHDPSFVLKTQEGGHQSLQEPWQHWRRVLRSQALQPVTWQQSLPVVLWDVWRAPALHWESEDHILGASSKCMQSNRHMIYIYIYIPGYPVARFFFVICRIMANEAKFSSNHHFCRNDQKTASFWILLQQKRSHGLLLCPWPKILAQGWVGPIQGVGSTESCVRDIKQHVWMAQFLHHEIKSKNSRHMQNHKEFVPQTNYMWMEVYQSLE